MISDDLRKEIEDVLSTKISSAVSVAGGCINSAATITADDGSPYFLKWNVGAPPNFFQSEESGLEALRSIQALKIPEVLAVSTSESRVPFILLEFLEAVSPTSAHFESLGRGLARIHRKHAGQHGFESDNFIGTNVQINTEYSTWGEFFVKARLVPQVREALDQGWLMNSLSDRFFQNVDRIQALLDRESELPSLLHGDLWSGNVLFTSSGPTLIDPACYYGHREADIAMTELFGGFTEKFYDAYTDEFPLSDLYEFRRELLNLYHLLNHANLFGGSYQERCTDLIKEI